jgi:O-antigen/teichoic acid export membrane protein
LNTVRKSVAINLAQNYGVMVLQFVCSIILARILSPSEIGIYSVAASLIALAQAVRDFGVGQYIIQEKDLTQDRIRSAFSAALIVAFLLAIITVSVATIAADFYKEPGIGNVLFVLALNFVAIPFGQISLACLQREMKFSPIAQSKIFSAIVYAIVVLSLAYEGFSYMSLAWASLASTISSVFVATIYRPKYLPWTPGFSQIRRIMAFGGLSVGSNLAAAFAKGTPDLVIGRLMNMSMVGLLSRANGLVEIFNQGVMNAVWAVALPHFSKTVREGGDLKIEYLRSAEMITGVAWSFFIFLAIMAEPMVNILYGPKWMDCVPLVKWVCFGYIAIAPFYLYSSIFVSTGNMKINLYVELGCLFLQFLLYLFAGLYGGIEMVAAVKFIYEFVKALVIYFVFKVVINLEFYDLFRSLRKSFVVAIVSGSCCYALIDIMDGESNRNFVWMLIGSIGALAGWLVSIFGLKHSLKNEIERLFMTRFL